MSEQCADPYARGGGKHGLWWADTSYLRPGLHFRRRCIVPVSEWLLRPGFKWRTRGVPCFSGRYAQVQFCPHCDSDYVAWPDPDADRPEDVLDCLVCGRQFEAQGS